MLDELRQSHSKENEESVDLQGPISLQEDHLGLVEEDELESALSGALVMSSNESFNIWTPDSSWDSMILDPLSDYMVDTPSLPGFDTNLLDLDNPISFMTDQMPLEEVFRGGTIPRSLPFSQDTFSFDIPVHVGDDL